MCARVCVLVCVRERETETEQQKACEIVCQSLSYSLLGYVQKFSSTAHLLLFPSVINQIQIMNQNLDPYFITCVTKIDNFTIEYNAKPIEKSFFHWLKPLETALLQNLIIDRQK